MKYLLDTCVISEIIKPQADGNVIAWMQSQNEDSLYLSVLTLGEIEKGIEKTYVVKVTPHSKACFLKVSFYTDYDNAPRDYIIIKNEPEATHWQLPENVSEKEGVIYKNFSKI